MSEGTEASHVRPLGPGYEDLSIATSSLQYLSHTYRTHKRSWRRETDVVVLMDDHTHDIPQAPRQATFPSSTL